MSYYEQNSCDFFKCLGFRQTVQGKYFQIAKNEGFVWVGFDENRQGCGCVRVRVPNQGWVPSVTSLFIIWCVLLLQVYATDEKEKSTQIMVLIAKRYEFTIHQQRRKQKHAQLDRWHFFQFLRQYLMKFCNFLQKIKVQRVIFIEYVFLCCL